MTAIIHVDTFPGVTLNGAWRAEDGNFTSWLEQAETIGHVGAAMNLDLEVEAAE
jgi:hypothetical protein